MLSAVPPDKSPILGAAAAQLAFCSVSLCVCTSIWGKRTDFSPDYTSFERLVKNTQD